MTFNKLEQEAIVLSAAMGMIDDMVNHAIFCSLSGTKEDIILRPQSPDTLRQFSILLRDFLAPVTAKGKAPMPFDLPKPPNDGKTTDHTTLFYLTRICENPSIGTDIDSLDKKVKEFTEWLESYAYLPNVWFSNIRLEVDLRIKRIDFIRMGGDIGKHNFLRLGGQASKLKKILANNGKEITESEAYAALPDCWEWFHTHLFDYHASTLAEFLNNIRYATRNYLTPVAKANYRKTGMIDSYGESYAFKRPSEIRNEFAWMQYQNLLDSTRSEPYFPRFSVTKSLKKQF